ncbi:MAG: 23S rRNA (guanosine(2251)-2'-O)-methyltransferase RlmB [Nitrospirales bacterium]|nr:23S rRNA (guanosine(2251)-2'-O)-methyltransferase RlmB [Nitrospirales bacterium]
MKREWIYGINPVQEAIRSGRIISVLCIASQRQAQIQGIAAVAESKGIPLEVKERDFFDSRFPKGHQGIAAEVLRKETVGIDELLHLPGKKGETPFFLILDCIEDPRNFGAILRVAESLGAHGVVFQSRRSAGITPLVAKASAGALEHVSLSEVVNVKHAIKKMKEMDIKIIGAEADSDLMPWDVDMREPVAIVMGSEGEGLRRTVKEMCDIIVRIPMQGMVNSLNVSVATGIISYEVVKQRMRA